MSLTEYERLQVLKWFEEAMGAEIGANMMKLVPPVGWGDIATKTDLRALEDRLDTRIDRLDTRIDGLDTKIDGLAVTLRGEMAELRGEMRGLPGGLAKTFVTWLLASQAATIAVVGFLLR